MPEEGLQRCVHFISSRSHVHLIRGTHSTCLAHKAADRKGKARENPSRESVEEVDVDLEPEIEEMNLDSMAIDEGEHLKIT
jgi:hypothetical protein